MRVSPENSARFASREPNVRIVPTDRMRARLRPLLAVGALALAVLLGSGCGGSDERRLRRLAPRLREGAGRLAAPLAALHKQANELLDGGTDGLREADRRRCAATRSSSTSGPPGASPAAGVPGPAEALGPLREAGRLPRRQLRRLRRRRRHLPARGAGALPQLHRPRQRDPRLARRSGASPTPPSTTAPASSSISSRVRTPTSPNSKPTFAATPWKADNRS